MTFKEDSATQAPMLSERERAHAEQIRTAFLQIHRGQPLPENVIQLLKMPEGISFFNLIVKSKEITEGSIKKAAEVFGKDGNAVSEAVALHRGHLQHVILGHGHSMSAAININQGKNALATTDLTEANKHFTAAGVENSQQYTMNMTAQYGASQLGMKQDRWLQAYGQVLTNIAAAAGFAADAINSVIQGWNKQYNTKIPNLAVQMDRSIMNIIMERLRSVDDLAKQKLEEMKKEDSEGKKLGPEEKRKKLRDDAERILAEEEEKGKKAEKKAPEPAVFSGYFKVNF